MAEGPILHDVRGCTRCGGDHLGLFFARLTKPLVRDGEPTLTHWCECPTNGEPIMLRMVKVREVQVSI